LISCDEQPIGFKGNHFDVQRVKYKKEGDGSFYMMQYAKTVLLIVFSLNMPAPKHYLDLSFSPPHARCLFMIDQLKGPHHV
jgi:hypothetical protein